MQLARLVVQLGQVFFLPDRGQQRGRVAKIALLGDQCCQCLMGFSPLLGLDVLDALDIQLVRCAFCSTSCSLAAVSL